MHTPLKIIFTSLILFLLLNLSFSTRPKDIPDEVERIKKAMFIDSYALSLGQLSYRNNTKKDLEEDKKRKIEEVGTTLNDVGFFPFDAAQPYNLRYYGYSTFFRNIGKDRSKFILYPYGFKYRNKTEDGIEKEYTQNKGGFFSLNSTLVENIQYIEKIVNISDVKISKSKALYDIDIGILTYEALIDGKKINLFSDSRQICGHFTSTLYKVSACAETLSELDKFRAKDPNKGNILMITPEILKNKNFKFKSEENHFELLIIPDHIIDMEDKILNAWGNDGIQKIINFRNSGGNILTTGKSGYILEKLGLLSDGTYKTDYLLRYQDQTKDEKTKSRVGLVGCEDIVGKSPSEQDDFLKQVMCMNKWKSIFLTSTYLMDKTKVEDQNDLSIVMSLESNYINNNLKLTSISNANDEKSPTENYFPLVLTKQENNKGAIIILNGNVDIDYNAIFELILNPMFYSMGKNIIFDAYVKYSDGMDENAPIPGGEAGVRLNCFFKFLNLDEKPIEDITVDVFIAQKTIFTSENIPGCTIIKNDKTKYDINIYNLTDIDSTQFMECNLAKLEKYSEFSKIIVIEITDQSVTQKATAIPLFYPFLKYKDPETNEQIFIDYGPVTVNAALSAILRVTANSEPPGDYPLYGYGNFFDQVFNIENKENTKAKNINLVSVIPIVSILVNDIEDTSVVHTNQFYDEYYKTHKYKFPFTETAKDVDFIDYAELSGKDAVIVKDFEQPVRYDKVERNDILNSDDYKDNNIFEVTGDLLPNIHEDARLKTNNQMLLKQTCYKDADLFYEVADYRRFAFLDTSSSDGAKAYYNNNIPEEEQDPADPTRAKIEVPFSRVDVHFQVIPNYQLPENASNDTVFTIDKYDLEPTIKTNEEIKKYDANISKVGNFDSSKEDGKLIPDEFYNVFKQHNQIKKFIDPLKPGYNITKDYPEIKVSHYLIMIRGQRITRAGSIKDFIEDEPDSTNPYKQGYLSEYPSVKFIYAHTVTFIIGKQMTRLGGKLVIDLGTHQFKNDKLPTENEFVTLSVDGVAVYKIEYDYVKGEKNIITAYFKRGLMPDEISGKDSSVDLNIENLTTTENITANIKLYELKYDFSKKESEYEDYILVESFQTSQTLMYQKFWSLPCLVIKNKFIRNITNEIKEYELIDPYARYTLYYQELLKHRTVFTSSLTNHPSNPGLQTLFSSYGLISNIGIVSIPFSDYVTHPALIIPAATSTSRVEWEDVWGRKWAQPIRSIFPDFLPLPYVSQNFMMSTTYEIIQNNERVLEWSSADSAYVMIHIKFLNNYWKYVNLAICAENSLNIGNTEYDNVTMNHSKVYGKCYQDTRSFLSGTPITQELSDKMDQAMLCPESKNAQEMSDCAQRIKSLNLPLLQVRDPKVKLPEGYKWNYSPLVESYYPEGYLDEEIMWDMTKSEYASDVYFKGYPWHYDNNLPGFDRREEKAENLMAFPIFKGFGYKMDYAQNNTVPNRYKNNKGWWSDNLQNKDTTLLAGQKHVVINPTINNTILTKDSWINGKKINSDIMRKKLKNIYVCQFNQHRIKIDPKNNKQKVTPHNTYQNNVIPIYSELDDKEYFEYNCDENQYQYSPENISLADNRIRTNNDRDWLYFALNLRAEAKETLNIILNLDPFSDRQYEGETKINDGGRFTYWNPALTKNGYIYLDNNVNIVNSFRVDIEADVDIFPNVVNTFKAVNYHLFTLEDKKEYLREYKSKTYTNSYGFGDSAVLIYVGGTEDTDCRLSPGQTTYIKITFYNNAGFDWNLKAGAITAAGLNIKPNTLMKDNGIHSVKVPTAYNFLELVIPEPLKGKIDIRPSDHKKDVLPQFFDFEGINVVTIRDGYIGEYYYKMTLKEGLDKKYWGRMWEIKVNLKSEYFDVLPGMSNDPATKVKYDITFKHDYELKVPSIKFGIPYPSDYKNPDLRNKVFYTIGRAHNLTISYNIEDEFTLDDIKIVSDEEVEKIRDATSDTINVNEKLLKIWNNGISNKTSYKTGGITTKILEPVNGFQRIYIFLNKAFPEFPYEIYGEPDHTKINILIKVNAPQVEYGSKVAFKWGYCNYNDSKVLRNSNTNLIRRVSSAGPWMNVDIEYLIAKYDRETDTFIETNDKHYPPKGYMKLKITAANTGDKSAYQMSYKYIFSKYVNVLTNYGDFITLKNIMSTGKESSGEDALYINSKNELPPNMKAIFNVFIFYDFSEAETDTTIIVRNLEDDKDKDKVILTKADVTLCQNAKCENANSFVNQLINVDFKMPKQNMVEQDAFELVDELLNKDKDKANSKTNEESSKSKAWIAGVIIPCLIIVGLSVYIFIDFKKKLWIFKPKEQREADVIEEEEEKPKTNEKVGVIENTERINVERKVVVQNSCIDMKINTNN